MVREIPLTKGYVALVDDDDYEFVSQFKWCVMVKHRKHHGAVRYAGRSAVMPDGRRGCQRMHQLILGQKYVDHKDHDGLNNQRANLRPATNSQNIAHARTWRTKSPYRGVQRLNGRRDRTNPWQAIIRPNGNRIHLGVFPTAVEAARAYDAAAKEHWGEFAILNFPETEECINV